MCFFGEDNDDTGLVLYHKGKTLVDSNKTLKDMEIYPNTKLLAMGSTGIMNKVVRMEEHHRNSWYFDSNSRDGVAFTVDRPIKIVGIGVYCPDK